MLHLIKPIIIANLGSTIINKVIIESATMLLAIISSNGFIKPPTTVPASDKIFFPRSALCLP